MGKVMSEENIFDDFPVFTPGYIGWGTLYKILEWQQRHGIAADVTEDQINDYREDGFSAAQTGLNLGLIDYPQATGCED